MQRGIISRFLQVRLLSSRLRSIRLAGEASECSYAPWVAPLSVSQTNLKGSTPFRLVLLYSVG